MAKEILKRQLDEIQSSIRDTLDIIRKLLKQASSVGELIKHLSEKKETNSEIIEKLKTIKLNLDQNINELVKSLDKLFDEYQQFIDNTL